MKLRETLMPLRNISEIPGLIFFESRKIRVFRPIFLYLLRTANYRIGNCSCLCLFLCHHKFLGSAMETREAPGGETSGQPAASLLSRGRVFSFIKFE